MSEKEFIPPHPLNTAVLFLIFNRPDVTKRVFEAIRQAKPPRLYVAADGPRKDKEGEAEVVQKVRKLVMDNIDWDCDVKTLFREKNLGCKYAVSGAIDWFFENEEMGIILEDDCLPSQSFFWFCEELLQRYKDDMRVWHITGNNFHFRQFMQLDIDYSFIRFPQVWGWATWSNRWKLYDKSDISFWSNLCDSSLNSVLNISKKSSKLFIERLIKASDDRVDTWDYQWHGTVIKNHGLCIVPNRNLISNIGGGENATHTKNDSYRTNLSIYNIELPLSHPKSFLISNKLEKYFKDKMNIYKPLSNKINEKISKILAK